MKPRLVTAGLLALALSAWTVNACTISGVVSCPNGTSAAGIEVYVISEGNVIGLTATTADGAYLLEFPNLAPGTYEVCVLEASLPGGFTLATLCQFVTVNANDLFVTADFTLGGPACQTPPPPGLCWLTGGGTIGKTRGVANYSYGGVVNPGCSPVAAGGGNWNVVDHRRNLHFKGLTISVIGCSGVSDKAPKVNVNIIDFEGFGTLEGIANNPMPQTAVCFRGRAVDKGEPGGGKDALYLNVNDCNDAAHPLLLISDAINTPEVIAPVAISTGNLQIHTTGCSK